MELGSGHVFQFTIDMSVADTELDSVASTFCKDHAEEIGVDVVNIESGCVEPVMRFLTEQVNTHNAKQSEQAVEPTIISVREEMKCEKQDPLLNILLVLRNIYNLLSC